MLDPSVLVNTPPQEPIDGCPQCVLNTEEPLDVFGTAGTNQLTALYRCSDCGHRWHTSWLVD